MTLEEAEALVRTVLPKATVTGAGWIGGPFSQQVWNGITLVIDPGEHWTYDEMLELSEVLGTTNINFTLEHNPGYSEYTPGSDSTMKFSVRWD